MQNKRVTQDVNSLVELELAQEHAKEAILDAERRKVNIEIPPGNEIVNNVNNNNNNNKIIIIIITHRVDSCIFESKTALFLYDPMFCYFFSVDLCLRCNLLRYFSTIDEHSLVAVATLNQELTFLFLRQPMFCCFISEDLCLDCKLFRYLSTI